MPHYLALLGHSHIHWLMSKYVKSGNMDVPNAKPKDLSNFEINADELRVGYYGSRGLKFRHIQNEPDCELRLFCQALPQNSLKEAILWLGDNDVMGSSPLALSNQIITLAEELVLTSHFNKVHIMQILPRYISGSAGEAYNGKAAIINEALEERCKVLDNISFINKVFHFPSTSLAKFEKDKDKFIFDGIHLNSLGQRRVYKKFKSIAIKLANHR